MMACNVSNNCTHQLLSMFRKLRNPTKTITKSSMKLDRSLLRSSLDFKMIGKGSHAVGQHKVDYLSLEFSELTSYLFQPKMASLCKFE